MSQSLLQWSASQGFLPHGYCFQWSPELLSLMVGSDAVIALAYFTIPLALLVFVKRRTDLRFDWIFLMFSAFIFLCGSTHVVEILTIWSPAYWLQGYLKALTALVSLLTAACLWWLIPRALKLPSTAMLEQMVARLGEEIKERRAAEAELAQLSQVLEARVQERSRQLEQSTAERLRLQDADRARVLAEAASRAKSEFMSRMSHELRTPLNAVLGFSQLLAGSAALFTKKQLDWLGHIETSGWHLLKLVDDLLDLGSIESGEQRIASEPVDLQTALSECREMVSGSAEEAQVQLDVALDGAGAIVQSDGRRLRQVLSNLLSNAIKYNRAGGQVKARLWLQETLQGPLLHIEVSDTGVGMSEAQREQLFQPFNRLGREQDPQVPGTGLGLVIVKQVVDALQGRIRVESQPDQGTSFFVEWPVGRASS